MAETAVPAAGGGEAPGPTIAQIVPPRGPAAGGTTLRLLGSGFDTPTSVRMAGTKVPSFHFISDAEVQIVTPPGLPGDAKIVVTVAGKESTGPDQLFLYIAAPVIASATETGKRWIAVEGTDLTPVLSASIGSAAASGIDVQATSVRIRRPAGPSGDMPIRVVTSGGSSAPFTISISPGWSRLFVFWLATTYFAMLVALLVTYMLIPGFFTNLPAQLGPLPIVIPWTGALGAVTLSLSGVIYHSAHRDWDSNYLMWHIARPLLGAAFASIAYFIIAGGVLASGGTPNAHTTPVSAPTSSPSPSPSRPAVSFPSTTTTTTRTTTASAVAAANALVAGTTSSTSSTSSTNTPAGSAATGGGVQNLFYIVVAFVIGYREQSFRQLIAKVSDLILGPGSGADSGDGGPKHADTGSATAAQPGSNGGGRSS